MSAMQMVSHMRSPDAQREWQHNLDFMPESLHKVGPTHIPVHNLADSNITCKGE